MRLRIAAGLICTTSLIAQSEAPKPLELLHRIRQHMKERLEQVPNYTCLETVERFEQISNSTKFKLMDTIRIEVAEVDGKELFARPGEKFEETNPAALAKGGFMANGLFALHSRALFLENTARFTYAGEDEIDGHKLVRYDYEVPVRASGYAVVVAGRQAIVPYHGSLWSDPKTLDAYHFRLVADDIPQMLGIRDTGFEIDYQSVTIGKTEALLPKRADLMAAEVSGRRMRNITIFSNCKRYGSESTLTFEPK